ncbi:hypothetical protein BDM02DRAFT_3130271 [Thelephora ganbajun]|uniref:Uncharacterized protein n=1 Tax=Thelephora ganbajun TaxID=370292 RepID=A0ACB6ZA74_THEGA|nr:hypothetical protein BDM02DRAFT_3130271 [Thelephora ganbajun]
MGRSLWDTASKGFMVLGTTFLDHWIWLSPRLRFHCNFYATQQNDTWSGEKGTDWPFELRDLSANGVVSRWIGTLRDLENPSKRTLRGSCGEHAPRVLSGYDTKGGKRGNPVPSRCVFATGTTIPEPGQSRRIQRITRNTDGSYPTVFLTYQTVLSLTAVDVRKKEKVGEDKVFQKCCNV